MRRTVLLLALLAMVSAAAASPASAEVTVRVAAPQQDAVVLGRAVVVDVRVTGRVAGFGAVLRSPRGSRPVAGRFARVRPGVWHGRLRVGRELRPGVNHLSIRVRRPGGRTSVAVRHFVMATRRADVAATVGARGPAALGYAFRLRPGARFRAHLNGRDVSRAFVRGEGRVWRGELGPRHGARYGANRLRFVAYDETGRYEVLRRRDVLRRDRPLADAGEDRVVHPRKGIRLDGRASRGAGAGTLGFRWRIASKPSRSRGRLVGATGVRPRLVGATPGHYRVELRVNDPQAGSRSVARDSVTLSVQQPDGPAGVPIQTSTDPSDPGIMVGSTFYPGQAGYGQILVLDRDTLTPTEATDPTQQFVLSDQLPQTFTELEAAITDEQLVVITGPGAPLFGQVTISGEESLLQSLQPFGAVGDEATFEGLASGQYTLIGIPGLLPGAATENRGTRIGNLPPGSVTGSFVTDIHSNYSFMWPTSYLPFDTQAPGSTDTQNRVTVAGQTFVSDEVTDQYGGWQLVWLDADTLDARGNFTFQNCFGAAPCLDGMLAQLTTILSDPTPGLVVLSSINNTQHTGRAAITTDGGILQAVGELGGNESAFTVAGEYTLVGLAGLGDQGTNLGLDLNQAVAGSPSSRLAGLLRRNEQGLLLAGTSGAPGPTEDVSVWQPTLRKVLAQPAQPFPAFTSAGQQAAVRYIAAGVELPAVQTAADLRALYWTNDSIVWSDKVTDLAGLAACPSAPCSGAFARVRATLGAEWQDVDTVRDYFTGGGSDQLDGIYSRAFADSTLGFVAIADGVMSSYPKPPGQPARPAGWAAILDSSLTIARGFTGFLPLVGAPVTAALSVGQGAEDLFRAATTTPGGAQALDPRVFEGDVFSFGSDLEAAWTAQNSSFSTVADILVSDGGRLAAASTWIQAAGADSWGLDTTSAKSITTSLQASIDGYIWSAMMPVSTQVFTCIIEQRVPGTPASDQATLTYFTSEQAGTQGGPPYQVSSSWAYLASAGDPTNWPTAAVLQKVFGRDTDNNQLGLQPEYFMAWGARNAWGDPNGAANPAGRPGFTWVSEMRDGGACQAGGP